MRRNRVVEGLILLAGIVIFLGGLAHDFAGWPAMAAALPDSTDTDVRAGLFIGWTFGGVAMDVLAILVLMSLFQLRRGVASAWVTPFVVGLFYAGFGLWALFYRDFNPHFLFFVILGLLLLPAWLLRPTVR